MQMKLNHDEKDFVVSKIEASKDLSQYVYFAFTDPNEPDPVSAWKMKIHHTIN
jgi:hypothetical protein